jgi:hypothetical protein
MEAIPLDVCMWCLEGQSPHQDWHPTRADLLSIGEELSRRTKARDEWGIKALSDDQLVGFGIRMRRVLAMADQDGVPDFLCDLVREWLEVAKKEWQWRRRAAEAGADPVLRSGGTWPERVERVKAIVELGYLIADENDKATLVAGRGWKCCCPFHADREPSLDIDIRKRVWLCRACGVGGDCFTYVQLRLGLTFVQAVEHLEERFGIRPPEPVRVIRGISSDD